MIPGLDATRAAAARHAPAGAPLVEPPALDALPTDAPALLVPFPTRWGPLIPTLQRLAGALREDGLLIVSDLVWQTAPTTELVQAFTPAAKGAERVRPIEGYEMQAEHAGLDLVAREELPREAWLGAYEDDATKRDALAKDDRGAAKVAVWVFRRAA